MIFDHIQARIEGVLNEMAFGEKVQLMRNVAPKDPEAFKGAQEEFVRVCTEIAKNDLKD
jgi:hypothetical protein